jgi:hypothetical protein
MQSYEFNAVVHNGIIRVPKQYLGKQISMAKVILLPDTPATLISNRKNKFTAMKLKTVGFKFNREEANER